MRQLVSRQTVDLALYPDLAVVYLGMRVNVLTGLKTLFGFGPQIQKSAAANPEDLLLHEPFETWARSEPHKRWWTDFLRDSGGTGFWHET